MTEAAKIGRKPFFYAELQLNSCSLEYAVTCNAPINPGLECFNTFATCKDKDSYTKVLKSYLFGTNKVKNVTAPLNEIEISNILAGSYKELVNGVSAPYTPPKLSAKTEILNNRTMGGHFVGRSVLSGQYDFIIKNKNITPEWIEENWLSLHKQISEKPFMYLWDDTRPQDAVFCWTKGDIPPPKYDNQCYFSFSIPCNGFIEND